MSQSFYFNDQNVFAEDLNNTESSRIADIKNRIQNLLGSSGGIYNGLYSSFSIEKGGVFGRPDEYAENKNLKVGLSDDSTLFIYPGNAIDVNGNPIRIETTKTVELGNEDSNYIWTPTTGDNYIKLKYIQSSGSVGLDDLGNQYYTRYNDSYFIEINGTHPSGSAGNPILLAKFTGLGDGSVSLGTLFDRRLYARIITPANAVIIDPFRNPVSAQTTMADHVNATGSGTSSLKNIHGLSYEDIGGEDVGLHRIQSHINGIIPYDRETATLNSFKGAVVNNNSPTAAINFTASSNAILSVGGKIISSSLSSLSGASAFSIGGNNTYAAIVDKNGTTSWVLYSTFIASYYDSELGTRIDDTGVNELLTTGHKNSDYYLLGICAVSAGGNTLTFTDTRSFLTTHPEDIIADFKEDVSSPADDLTKTSSLEDTLDRIRNQIGIAIAGAGSSWNNATSNLTNGSNADSLHKHSHDNLDDIVGTNATAANLETLTAGTGSNADSLHTHSEQIFEGSSFVPYHTQDFSSLTDKIVWTLDTGSLYKTFDYLNLLGGNPTASVLSLPAGIYQISAYIYASNVSNGNITGLWLTLGDYTSADDEITTSIAYNNSGTTNPLWVSTQAVIEITGGESLVIGTDVENGASLRNGRLDIIKLSDYPVS